MDILILIVLALAVAGAVYFIRRKRASGGTAPIPGHPPIDEPRERPNPRDKR